MKVVIKHAILNINHTLEVTKEDCASNKTFYHAMLRSGMLGSAILFPLDKFRKKTLTEIERREKLNEK